MIRAVVALAISALSLTPAQGQRDLRAAAAPTATVRVDVQNGSVTVTGWDNEEVLVRVRGSGRDLQLTGDRLNIVIRDENSDLDIRVPRRVRLNVRTHSGDIGVSEVTGSLYLESLSGDFRVAGEPQRVEVEGVSGSVDILGRPQDVKINVVSGDVHLPRAAGAIDASTTSGDLHVTADGLERGNFSSTSGSVVLRGSPARTASLYLDTASGTIELRLDRSFPADYDISTVSGAIRNDFGPAPTRLRYAGSVLRFSTGSGARVRASSVSGRVVIGS